MKGFWFLLVATAAKAIRISFKQEYVVGGWLPGTAHDMLLSLRPLFESYLNENVGEQFDPQISFQLIPVDFSPETDSDPLMKQGKLDFICES